MRSGDTETPATDAEVARAASEVARRAIRRLDILEWVTLAGAGAVAIAGGGLVALLVAEPMGIPIRWMWTALSLFLFGVPGAIVVVRQRREERSPIDRRSHESEDKDV